MKAKTKNAKHSTENTKPADVTAVPASEPTAPVVAPTVPTATAAPAPATAETAAPVATNLVQDVAAAVSKERTAGAVLFQIVRGPETVTAEAHGWLLNRNAIPNAGFAPIRFVGWDTVNKLSELVKRPLTLEEVQLLVQADGSEEICLVDNATFQPVRYAPFVPQDVKKAIEADPAKKLTELSWYYGGAFYQNDRVEDGRVICVSGCVFNSRGEQAAGSPLVMTAFYVGKALRKKGGVLWGEDRTRLNARLEQRQHGRAEFKRRVSRIDEVFAGLKPSGYRNNPFGSLKLNGAGKAK